MFNSLHLQQATTIMQLLMRPSFHHLSKITSILTLGSWFPLSSGYRARSYFQVEFTEFDSLYRKVWGRLAWP